MKVAEVVVRILEDEGITAAFGIPGAAIKQVYQYLPGSSIKHYISRREEGAVHAADGTAEEAKTEILVQSTEVSLSGSNSN